MARNLKPHSWITIHTSIQSVTNPVQLKKRLFRRAIIVYRRYWYKYIDYYDVQLAWKPTQVNFGNKTTFPNIHSDVMTSQQRAHAQLGGSAVLEGKWVWTKTINEVKGERFSRKIVWHSWRTPPWARRRGSAYLGYYGGGSSYADDMSGAKESWGL